MRTLVIPSVGWGPVLRPLPRCRTPGPAGPQPALGITVTMVLLWVVLYPWLPINFLKSQPFLTHTLVIPSVGWGPVLRPLPSCKTPGTAGPPPALGITARVVRYRGAIDPWAPINFLKNQPFLMRTPVIPSGGWGPVLTPLPRCRTPGIAGPQPALGITARVVLLWAVIDLGLPVYFLKIPRFFRHIPRPTS
jgi:hypothetical protein